jgi:hypothetical protein
VTVTSSVDPGSCEAKAVAEQFWTMYSQPTERWETEAVYPAIAT